MRAARLLQILLLLQNRGRLTSVQLARELEVAPRTILRDVDAMTEAGLPIIVFQGQGGGIELGFNYRTRLTGLAQDEAVALGLILAVDNPLIAAAGLQHAAKRAQTKLVESLPDRPREQAKLAMSMFEVSGQIAVDDARVRAMSAAVRASSVIRIRFATKSEQEVHPIKLILDGSEWLVSDQITDTTIPISNWGRLNVSSKQFVRQRLAQLT